MLQNIDGHLRKISDTSGKAAESGSKFSESFASLAMVPLQLAGVSTAMTGNATAKTVQRVSRAITVPVTIDTGPSLHRTPLFFSITPTSGTLGSDDVIIEGIYFTAGGLIN